MPKNIELLLTENVEALGIVGDVVKVRSGYARNYLLPRNLATTPTEEMIKALAAKRAEAERQLAELRRQREQMIQKMQGTQVETIRACNDQGVLYAAVTQQDIADLLGAQGYTLRPRDVRLGQTIKRVGSYEVHIKFDADLEAVVKLVVQPDRKLDLDEEEESETPEEQAEAPAAGGEAAASDDKAKADKKN
jgi:large subunit ribosomal protein L9